jgi:hypothetical protein
MIPEENKAEKTKARIELAKQILATPVKRTPTKDN